MRTGPAVSIRFRVVCQLSIFTPPGVCLRHLILNRGELMADSKEPKEIRAKAKGKNLSESSPNPHGESKILQMPIKTHQRHETGGRNVPQVPNTVGAKLNPSVAHEFQGNVASDKNAADKRTRTPKPVTQMKRKDA